MSIANVLARSTSQNNFEKSIIEK